MNAPTMTHDPCPVWAGYLLASPFRKLLVNPRALLSPYVREGMTVLEPGPAFGFFTLHEMPSARGFFLEASTALKRGALLLFAEPSQVGESEFQGEVSQARQAGLTVEETLSIRSSRAVLLRRAA